MGLVIPQRRDAFRSFDTLVTAAAYAGGTASAIAWVALTAALLTLGWRDLRYVAAPSGVGGSLVTSLLVLAFALPVTCSIAIAAAACVSDATIGGAAGNTVRGSLEWSTGIPPVVIGLAVFVAVTGSSRLVNAEVAAAALIVLNLPYATARFSQAFSWTPAQAKEAAAAAGASPAATFFSVVLPRSSWATASIVFALAAQMMGETSAIVAAGANMGTQPLTAQIWHYASNPALARSEAASCMLLIVMVATLAALSKACSSKRAEMGEP
jgi:ABC-type Fe3+ transport system permease subunit